MRARQPALHMCCVFAYDGGSCSAVAVTLMVQMNSARGRRYTGVGLLTVLSLDGDMMVLSRPFKVKQMKLSIICCYVDFKYYLRVG